MADTTQSHTATINKPINMNLAKITKDYIQINRDLNSVNIKLSYVMITTWKG